MVNLQDINMKKQPPSKKTRQSRTPKTSKKQSQQFLKVYWPYIPLFVLVFFGLIFGVGLPGKSTPLNRSGVLAYATEMSTSGLLSGTNTERANNGGLAALTLNSQLASAAQAKANDMVARNYWSHNTPDGKEPWTFMDAAGYNYQKAGENLAYGFATSSDTITGWMNSPSHRDNILDPVYREVGFGFANAPSYVGTGQETVVVAMYGNPATVVQAAPPAPSSAPASSPATVKSASNTNSSSNQPAEAAAQPITIVQDTVEPAPTEKTLPADRINQAINSDSPVPASQPATRITRIQSMTGAPWSAVALSIVVLSVTVLWALKHALIVKRVLVDGEKFLLHHPIIDVGVMGLVALSILLSQTSGVVK